MTTNEILSAFMKGREKTSISEKQKSWLLSQAKKEGIKTHFDGFSESIYLNDCHYKIKHCKVLASGGSYVGTRIIQGRFTIEKMYTIQFDSTGLTNVCNESDIKHYQTSGHAFKITNQLNVHA